MAGEKSPDPEDLAAKKEAWVQERARHLLEIDTHLSEEDAVNAARWAREWVDKYKERFDQAAPRSEEEATRLINDTRWAAVDEVSELTRYVTFEAASRIKTAAGEAFVTAFDPREADIVRRLMDLGSSQE